MARQGDSSISEVRKSGCMFLCCCYIASIHDKRHVMWLGIRVLKTNGLEKMILTVLLHDII